MGDFKYLPDLRRVQDDEDDKVYSTSLVPYHRKDSQIIAARDRFKAMNSANQNLTIIGSQWLANRRSYESTMVAEFRADISEGFMGLSKYKFRARLSIQTF